MEAGISNLDSWSNRGLAEISITSQGSRAAHGICNRFKYLKLSISQSIEYHGPTLPIFPKADHDCRCFAAGLPFARPTLLETHVSWAACIKIGSVAVRPRPPVLTPASSQHGSRPRNIVYVPLAVSTRPCRRVTYPVKALSIRELTSFEPELWSAPRVLLTGGHTA